jgi:hypothetical protein
MQTQKFNLSPVAICPLCGAHLPPKFANCRALFGAVCAREYTDPVFGSVHLFSVDAYALQHSEECGPRSNAFHLMRLCQLLERGASAELGRHPPRSAGKAFEERYREFPFLEPPANRGAITAADVFTVTDSQNYPNMVKRWARAVWIAYGQHHEWARRTVAAH